jgi:hypothetical protein
MKPRVPAKVPMAPPPPALEPGLPMPPRLFQTVTDDKLHLKAHLAPPQELALGFA